MSGRVVSEKTNRELDDLRACLSNLLAVTALPAIWTGSEPSRIIGGLLDALIGMLQLDFAFAELKDSFGGESSETVRLSRSLRAVCQPNDITSAIKPLKDQPEYASRVGLPYPHGDREVLLTSQRLGLHGDLGWLIAGARREDFPTETEKLLINVASNQAAVWLQESRSLNEHKQVAAELDLKVTQRTKELETERDRLSLLFEIDQALVANLELRHLFTALAGKLRQVTGCDFIGLALPDAECGLRMHIAISYMDKAVEITEGMAVPLEGSASGKVFRTRKLIRLDGLQGAPPDPEIYGTPEGKEFYASLLKTGIPSGYFLPLIHAGAVIGVMQLTKFSAIPLKSQTVEFLNALASQLAAAVANALEHRAVVASRDRLACEQVYLREEIDRASMFEEVVGSSPALQTVLARVSKVAPTDSTVLITGETGTGKELIARAIHKRSVRADKSFVSVNCAALPSSLIASELFGHERGAFTGANQRRLGRFELAQGGTLFLDEVGELPAEIQVALLRVLQEREFERVGGTQPIRADVRIIAATNRDLKAAIAKDGFRSDLFYRLNVFPIETPSLRARAEDIPALTNYFIHRYAGRLGRKITRINRKTLDLFQTYNWPGNIRELQNVIERSLILCETETFSVDQSWLAHEPLQSEVASGPLLRMPGQGEKSIIETALEETRGRVSGPSGAAARLGMPASTLESKIRVLKINKHQFKAR